MHGLGNSYIYIDCVRENNFFLDERKIFVLAKKLSDKADMDFNVSIIYKKNNVLSKQFMSVAKKIELST